MQVGVVICKMGVVINSECGEWVCHVALVGVVTVIGRWVWSVTVGVVKLGVCINHCHVRTID